MYNCRRGKRIPTRTIRDLTPRYNNGRNFRHCRNNCNNNRKRFQNSDYRADNRTIVENYDSAYAQDGFNHNFNQGFNNNLNLNDDFNADKPLMINFFPDENSREIIVKNEVDELQPWDLRNRISHRNSRRKLQYPRANEESEHEYATNEVLEPVVQEPKQERAHVAPVWSRISPPKTESEEDTDNILSSYVVIDEVFSDDFIPPINLDVWDIPTPGDNRRVQDIPTPGDTCRVTTSAPVETSQERFDDHGALPSPSVVDGPSADVDDSVIFVGYGNLSACRETSGNSNFAQDAKNVSEVAKADGDNSITFVSEGDRSVIFVGCGNSSTSHDTSGNSNFADDVAKNVAQETPGEKVIPEVAANPEPVKVYAVSAAETKDNCDPEWEVIKLLQTDDERYRAVRKRWKSLEVPDPFRNLTHHGYRQSRCPPRPGGHKRTMSQADPSGSNHDEQRPAKRQRIVGSCVDIFDTKLRAEEQSFQQTAQNLLCEQHKNVIQLTRSRPVAQWNPFMYSPDTVVRHEIRKCVSFYQSQIEMARAKHEQKMAKLSKHRQEVLQFYQFYSNLKNSGNETRNSVLLNEQQLRAIEETDYMHSLYENYYR